MKLNNVIILYLLFLLFVCMNNYNTNKIIEGAVFSKSNCDNVKEIVTYIQDIHDNECKATPSPTACIVLKHMDDFINREIDDVCKNEDDREQARKQEIDNKFNSQNGKLDKIINLFNNKNKNEKEEKEQEKEQEKEEEKEKEKEQEKEEEVVLQQQLV